MSIAHTLDSLWVLGSAFLVFFMHAGFALLEAGFCQRKNAVVVLTKNLAVVALASLLFYVVGFGLMFGDGNAVIGMSLFAPAADAKAAAVPASMPVFVFVFFQMVFAATAATIVSGAVAERVKLTSFLFFVMIASALIYPVVGHWVWGGGFLAAWGFHDFAGSSVVHAVGGAMALAGILAVGPRLDRFESEHDNPLPAHNLPLAALGVLILWLGWFGFNGGSTLKADSHAIAGVVLSTNLAASAGFVAALVHALLRTDHGKIDLGMALNGALAGLVAITAGADVIGPLEAMIVGGLGGVLVVEGIWLLDRLKLDDPVGAVPVHLMCGVFGTLATGVFANSADYKGILHGGGLEVLGIQALGAVVCGGFAALGGAIVWFAMRSLTGVRVDADHEREGLDIAECGVEAYHFGSSPQV